MKNYRSDRINLDDELIAFLYSEGNSEKMIADFFSVSRNAIKRRLEKANVTRRNQSEAEFLKWSQMNELQRHNQTAKVKVSMIGLKRSDKELEMRAKVHEKIKNKIGSFEDELCNRLKKNGLICNQQTAVHKYNLDLSYENFAIEVNINSHNPKTSPRYAERNDYLLSSGWNIIYLRSRNKNVVLKQEAVNQIKNIIEDNSDKKGCIWSVKFDGTILD